MAFMKKIISRLLAIFGLTIQKSNSGSKSTIAQLGILLSKNQISPDLEILAKMIKTQANLNERGIRAKGQLLQDLFVLTIFGEKEGTFLDLGGGHPTEISNSFLLQNWFNWSGYIVEPNPEFNDMQKRIRASDKVVVFEVAITGNDRGTANFTLDGEFSGLSQKNIGELHAKRRAKRFNDQIVVETLPIRDFIDDNQITKIDYLSIDVEGGELDIVSNFPFEKTQVSVITVEHNFRFDDLNEIQEILAYHDFVQIFRDQTEWDAWFISKRVVDKLRQ